MFCLPHAGADVSAFHGWAGLLDGVAEPVPVLLPGRGVRRREPRITDARALLAELLRGQGPPAAPYLLYGHSLGGRTRSVTGDHDFLRGGALPVLLGRLCRVYRRLARL
jgi:surfactin synthase thioesterase subunit